MPDVPKELIEHSLNINPKAISKKQRLHRFSAEKREAIKKELAKLLAAGFIKEVYHPEWLANPILFLEKNNNEWRMCVDYTDLNKHCPKDPFGLPRIDQVIDSTAGCRRCCRQNQDPGSIHYRSGRDLQQPPKISLETQPNQVCLWRTLWKTTRIHRQ